MTNFSGENLNAACGGPQGGGMDSRRNGVAEVSPNYLAEMASNSIPVGYKQTEVGVIPEDWDVCELQDAVNFLDGLRRPVKSGDRAKISGIYPYYGASGIVDYVNDYIFDDELILLGEDGENILSRNLPLAFKVSGKIWVNNHAHVMKPNEYFDITYLTEFLESLDYSLLNSGTAQPKLNKQACLRIKVAKPPRNEQTAIANALSDVDALISELEKLIAKKQAIKTATMQQLLTGRTRLPQFALREDGTPKGTKPSELGEIPEDWEVVAMGDLGSTYGGLSGKSKQDFGHGNSLYVPFTNVMANVVVDVDNLEKVDVREAQNNLALGDLLFNGSSETPEEVCFSALVSADIRKLYLNSFCFGFRSNQKNAYLPLYLAYWFRSEVGRAAVLVMAQGSTRYNISKEPLNKFAQASEFINFTNQL